MSKLTRQELLMAAKRARVYPRGLGDEWGWGPMVLPAVPVLGVYVLLALLALLGLWGLLSSAK